MCLLYCVLYLMTSLTMLTDHLPTLFFGRVCGGVSTTLLFSVFETWMITEYYQQGLPAEQLSSVFSGMTTLSSIVAILSGVIGDMLVELSGTRTWPFLAAGFCCVLAGFTISSLWVSCSHTIPDPPVDMQ